MNNKGYQDNLAQENANCVIKNNASDGKELLTLLKFTPIAFRNNGTDVNRLAGIISGPTKNWPESVIVANNKSYTYFLLQVLGT